jgi:hypothetical protein
VSAGTSIFKRVQAGDTDLGVDVIGLQVTGDQVLDEALDLISEGIPLGLQTWELLGWLEDDGLNLLEDMLARHGFGNVGLLPIIANTGQGAAMARGPIDVGSLSSGFLMRSFGYGQKVLIEAFPRMRFVDAVGAAWTTSSRASGRGRSMRPSS